MVKGVLFLTLCCLLLACDRGEPEQPAAKQPETAGQAAAAETGLTVNTLQTAPDTARINQLIRKGYPIFLKDPAKAIPIYEEALRICRQYDYPEGLAIIYNNLATCYYQLGDGPSRRKYEKLRDAEVIHIPSPYYNPESSSHEKFLLSNYDIQASNQFAAGEYDSSAALFTQILKRGGEPDSVNYTLIAKAYLGLGAVAGRIANFEGALAYFEKAENIGRRFSDAYLQLNALTNRAALYYDNGQTELARESAMRGLALSREQRDSLLMTFNANSIAASYMEEGEMEKALPYSQLVLDIAQQLGAHEQIVAGYYLLGNNYAGLGAFGRARDLLLKGLDLAREIGLKDNIGNVYGPLSVAYEGLGQYKEALQFQKLYSDVRDQQVGKEAAGKIAEIETKFRVAQKDKSLAEKDKMLLQQQLKIASQEKKQYIWIGGSLLAVLLLSGALYYKRYQSRLRQLQATISGEEKERSRLARELHDGIVSRLSIIKMNFSALPRHYANLNDGGDFQEVVNQLEQSISELRATSHNLLPATLEQAGLVASLHSYCEKIRKIALLDIQFQVIGNLPALKEDFQLNIYRIVQELVNNVLKHSNAKNALLQFQIQSGWLIITLDNDGAGWKTEEDDLSEGIGLKNLEERVHLYHGKIELENNRAGTSVYLEFNLKKVVQP